MSLAAAVERVRGVIAESARAAGRAPESVTLIAVSKHQPIDKVFEAHDLGVRDFGENTAQGLIERADAFARAGRQARWHFIGRLQRNKINQVLPRVVMLQTLDRPELAEAVAQRASVPLDVLVQVNVGDEPQKGGVAPAEAVGFARGLARYEQLRLRGLMCIPPAQEDPAPHFAALARLSQELRQTPEGKDATELSMGMSDDYAIAVRHGATMVRVGTGIFGERQTKGPRA